MESYLNLVKQLSRLLNLIAGIAITFVMALTVGDVILRIFGKPIVGTYELVAFTGAVVIGFAVPMTSWVRGHIYVDFFVLKMPRLVRNLFNFLTRCVSTALFYLIGGSFIDDLAFMVLATPIFYPVIEKLGFNPIWFGMIIMITVMIGVVVPPVAINVFVVKNITKVPFGVIYRGVLPFLLSLLVVAVLLFIFPGICTWLPDLLMK